MEITQEQRANIEKYKKAKVGSSTKLRNKRIEYNTGRMNWQIDNLYGILNDIVQGQLNHHDEVKNVLSNINVELGNLKKVAKKVGGK